MLEKIIKGKLEKPYKVLLYGVEGIGKSTFAAQSSKPIFLAFEDGTNHLDIDRFDRINSLDQTYNAIRALIEEDHDYETLVCDTIDALYPLIERHVCSENNWASIEQPGYGRGPNQTCDEFRNLCSMIERAQRERNMNVLWIGHCEIKRFNNPDGESYDRFALKIPPKSAGILKEWCDAVLFCEYETSTIEKDGKTKGVSSGKRIIHTERRAAFDAKNRYSMADTIPLSFHAFEQARKASLDSLLQKIDESKRTQTIEWIDKQPDPIIAELNVMKKLQPMK